ncbi:hypothetical protein DBR00_11495 [Pseudomonas sp. HMWF032]|uniref:hypothetical protein n=1 Tax=Pseudomonas sp. HMWF032 TaxID=2056866 RepID=UPI000D378496|nr:hypothetical protein [Pseudomonas sp. HMWF032]PTS83999.1 hypothetical protein DBR00_11495 [Pseudomonas sp. HMWF032]PTT85354.1 hypothetical protein DBR41_04080 [Pseudomonas sp. HMWF010]
MARVALIQTNFTAGEVSPRMYGRVDIARYANGAELIENAWPLIHGGGLRRDGLLFTAETKTSAKRSRLIPYVFNKSQAYMVEFGDLYIRIYRLDGTYTGVELVSPYTEAMLSAIDYVQGADTMFLYNTQVPIHRLRRSTDVQWSLAPAPFVTRPFDEKGINFATALTLSNATVGTGRTATSAVSAFLAADVGREIWGGTGVARITGVTSATVATVDVVTAFESTSQPTWALKGSPQTTCTPGAKDPVGAALTLTLGAAGWRADDVGKFVKVNRGLAEITAYVSATSVTGVIRAAMDAVVAAPANAWSLEASVWNDFDGYPATGTLHEQRLVAAGSPNYPQTIWESRTGEYLNFELGTKDDDAMSFTVSSDQINPITHMAQIKALIALTYGGEFSLTGGVEKPITPTNIQVKNQSVYGCNQVKPVRIGNELYFMQRANRKLRAMAYKYDSDAYGAPDMSVLSEHITESGIVDMAYQQEPESILFMPRADGVMATLTVDRDQDVIGWARQTTDGLFESVATIPTANGEQVWAIVNRTIGGVTKRYIERFTSGVNVDSGVVGTSVGGQSVWGGLGHLEGKMVDIVADGVVMQQQLVTGGEVTIPRLAFNVAIGLHYKSTIKTLTPEVAGPTGTAQGSSMRIAEVTLRFLNTIGCQINGQEIAFRNFGVGVLDTPLQAFSGVHRMENLGWERGEAQLTITQDQPLPFHLLSVIKKATFND